MSGGGNHRASIFRLIVGAALKTRDARDFPTWGTPKSLNKQTRAAELILEQEVSRYIGNMAFVWLSISGDAGPASGRADVERHAIALLSNYQKTPIDPPSNNWLGRHSDRTLVRESGLWNSRHVDERYDPTFLVRLDRYVDTMERGE